MVTERKMHISLWLSWGCELDLACGQCISMYFCTSNNTKISYFWKQKTKTKTKRQQKTTTTTTKMGMSLKLSSAPLMSCYTFNDTLNC